MMDENVSTLEKCRWKLEALFEDKFKPERDFIDFLQVKKDRQFEQIFEKCKDVGDVKHKEFENRERS